MIADVALGLRNRPILGAVRKIGSFTANADVFPHLNAAKNKIAPRAVVDERLGDQDAVVLPAAEMGLAPVGGETLVEIDQVVAASDGVETAKRGDVSLRIVLAEFVFGV